MERALGYWVLIFGALALFVVVVVILYRRARHTLEVMTASITLSANSAHHHVAIEPKLLFGDSEGMERVILGVWYTGHVLWLMGSRRGDRAPHDHLLAGLEGILRPGGDNSPAEILRTAGLPDLAPSPPPPPFNRISIAMRAPRAMPMLLSRELTVYFGIGTPEVHLVGSVFFLLSFVRSSVDAQMANVLWLALRTLVDAERQGVVSRSYGDKNRVCHVALSDACERASVEAKQEKILDTLRHRVLGQQSQAWAQSNLVAARAAWNKVNLFRTLDKSGLVLRRARGVVLASASATDWLHVADSERRPPGIRAELAPQFLSVVMAAYGVALGPALGPPLNVELLKALTFACPEQDSFLWGVEECASNPPGDGMPLVALAIRLFECLAARFGWAHALPALLASEFSSSLLAAANAVDSGNLEDVSFEAAFSATLAARLKLEDEFNQDPTTSTSSAPPAR